MKKQMVYYFGAGEADGNASMKQTLGGKGANLAEMVRLGLPVPAGFTISADVCHHYSENSGRYPNALEGQVGRALRKVERSMGCRFGDPRRPLLVSVRSGAAISMPGMMDTVLNLGLNDETVEGLTRQSGDARFAWDCYRRFVQMYGDVVLGLKPTSSAERDPFEVLLEKKKEERGIELDTELTVDDLQDLVRVFKATIRERTGKRFPEDPHKQLWGAIGAVFGSWNNERAITYRRLNKISEDLGTAVNVQSMVYGNIGEDSGTGVAFTRNPSNGARELYGEYLINAQGEDVVAGVRTPKPIIDLKKAMPQVYRELVEIQQTLEDHYREMQDVEFTIQRGTLWMLQTRTGKRTGMAAVRIAVDMVSEKRISSEEALLRVDPEQLNQLLRPVFDTEAKQQAVDGGQVLAKGLPAGPGAASGNIAFSAEEAVRRQAAGEDVLLVRVETSPDDIEGMNASLGILTSRGGMTSHAALVGRQMGKVCVVGCGDLHIDYGTKTMRAAGREFHEGDRLSIDGNTGEVLAGALPTRPSEVLSVLLDGTLDAKDSPTYRRYHRLMQWADKTRRMRVRANSDTGEQSTTAIALGAEGIGLCRTEHMFFGHGKIEHVQQMILAADGEERRGALAKLLPIQREDFASIFRAMGGRPVTIRLLDPPLHEFLPHTEHDQRALADTLGVSFDQVREKVEDLHEFNPMLGFRGCRLGIVYPEITEMQARAIFEAACDVKASGGRVQPEVMVPLIGHHKEFALQEEVIRKAAQEVMRARKIKVPYLVGTMIEVPRAALTADEIARQAEFFSFGTNDLTQTAFGLSRDDSGRFLEPYVRRDIYKTDPFQSLDVPGVGALVRHAVTAGRGEREGLKIGICGEHGGDPASVGFCHDTGLDYVSCSPYRLPIARLAAAQATVREAQAAAAAAAEARPERKKRKATRKKTKAKAKSGRGATARKGARATATKGAGGKKRTAKKAAKKKAAKKKAAKKKPVAKAGKKKQKKKVKKASAASRSGRKKASTARSARKGSAARGASAKRSRAKKKASRSGSASARRSRTANRRNEKARAARR